MEKLEASQGPRVIRRVPNPNLATQIKDALLAKGVPLEEAIKSAATLAAFGTVDQLPQIFPYCWVNVPHTPRSHKQTGPYRGRRTRHP